VDLVDGVDGMESREPKPSGNEIFPEKIQVWGVQLALFYFRKGPFLKGDNLNLSFKFISVDSKLENRIH
jgi:hypothetical protein